MPLDPIPASKDQVTGVISGKRPQPQQEKEKQKPMKTDLTMTSQMMKYLQIGRKVKKQEEDEMEVRNKNNVKAGILNDTINISRKVVSDDGLSCDKEENVDKVTQMSDEIESLYELMKNEACKDEINDSQSYEVTQMNEAIHREVVSNDELICENEENTDEVVQMSDATETPDEMMKNEAYKVEINYSQSFVLTMMNRDRNPG